MHLFLEILVDGFIISSIYALGAVGFSMIFGTAGVLNLSHGAFLVVSAMITWFVMGYLHFPLLLGIGCGVLTSIIISYLLFFVVVNPIDKSHKIPVEEKEIFILTATLLWSMLIRGILNFTFGSSPVVVKPFVSGKVSGVHLNLTYNEIVLAGLSLLVIALLWLFINKTKTGRLILAASMTHTGLAIMGIEIRKVYLILWGVYGLLTGIAGVLLASFLGVSAPAGPDLTGLAFSIVVLGGLGSIGGSFLASYIIGYLGTITAYLISPNYTSLPAFFVLVIVLLVRPKGLFGRF